MRATKPWLTLVVILVSFGMWYSVTQAEDTMKTRVTVRGLESVYVQVEPFDPELQKELKKGGLIYESVRQAVERKLEKGGIRVLHEEDLQKSQYHGILYVNLQILRPDTQKKWYTVNGVHVSKDGPVERYFYAVDIELRQTVSLLRDPVVKGLATTWSTGSLGFRRLSRIQMDVADQVDTFASAYLSVNSK